MSMLGSYTASLPLTGVEGWTVLQKTVEKQKQTMQKSAYIKREIAYFKEQLPKTDTTEKLMKNPRMLRFALTAFGLEDQLNSQALVKKILDGGTDDAKSLANRMKDYRYQDFANTFGYGNAVKPTFESKSFAQSIVDRYVGQQLQNAVGEQDNDMRVALYAQDRLGKMSTKYGIQGSGWYYVIADKPLREMFNTVFGLPDSFVQIDVDRQKSVYEARASAMFGKKDLTAFSDPKQIDKLVKRYLAISSANNSGLNTTSSAGIAYTLLSSAIGASSLLR
jgi:hypothetical protein